MNEEKKRGTSLQAKKRGECEDVGGGAMAKTSIISVDKLDICANFPQSISYLSLFRADYDSEV